MLGISSRPKSGNLANFKQIKAMAKQLISDRMPDRTLNSSRDICVYSTRRGGSTWLMEVLCATTRIRYVNQPFCHYSASVTLVDRLPQRQNSMFCHLSSYEEELVREYLAGIFSGRIKVNSRFDFWNPSFWRKPERIVLKIVSAKGLIEWIDENFRVHTIYQLRHPIAQSLSVQKAGWGYFTHGFLNDRLFVDKWLTADQLRYAEEVVQSNDPLKLHVLDWCLDNLIPLRISRNHPEWLTITYEEMCIFPKESAALISNFCGLDFAERMQKIFDRPSRTAIITNKTKVERDGLSQVDRWRAKISPERERELMEVLDVFGIDAYRVNESMPSAQYSHFRDRNLENKQGACTE